MNQVIAVSIFLVISMALFTTEARSPQACRYEPAGRGLPAGDFHIDYKPDGWCIRRVTCKDDYTLNYEECENIPCPADKRFEKESFPDCCCGGFRN